MDDFSSYIEKNSSTLNKGLARYYEAEKQDWPPPKKVKTKDGQEFESGVSGRKSPRSIFNRYCLFFVNQQENDAQNPENYLDSPNRISDEALLSVRNNPTASKIIEWSKTGNHVAADYAWEDFLWCKNYGVVPNNYMVTLRRFSLPPEDNLFSVQKNMLPEISRMVTFIDGTLNTWQTVGLRWTHKMAYKPFTGELQKIQSQEGTEQNEASLFGGGKVAQAARGIVAVNDSNASTAARKNNPQYNTHDPYQDKNKIYEPIDVVKTVLMRDSGLLFEQKIELHFEYELRSIDGINPRIAMIDLLSNIMFCTMNKGNWWGGENRYYGGNPRVVKPFGDPNKLKAGDIGGYVESVIGGIAKSLGNTFEKGLAEGLKTIGGNLLSQISGSGLDKLGRRAPQVINSLLTGESTGEWHLTVGNPANPIIAIGNLALTQTVIDFYGPLGADDFPTQLKVICSLEPARPRDSTDIISMFSRNNRTYLTYPLSSGGSKPPEYSKKKASGKSKKQTVNPVDSLIKSGKKGIKALKSKAGELSASISGPISQEKLGDSASRFSASLKNSVSSLAVIKESLAGAAKQ